MVIDERIAGEHYNNSDEELKEIAKTLGKMHSIGKNFKRENVFLVGDTPRDIWAAQKAGIKMILVATGSFSVEELKKENPDFVFKDFSDIKAIIDVI